MAIGTSLSQICNNAQLFVELFKVWQLNPIQSWYARFYVLSCCHCLLMAEQDTTENINISANYKIECHTSHLTCHKFSRLCHTFCIPLDMSEVGCVTRYTWQVIHTSRLWQTTQSFCRMSQTTHWLTVVCKIQRTIVFRTKAFIDGTCLILNKFWQYFLNALQLLFVLYAFLTCGFSIAMVSYMRSYIHYK